jgi:hypothetical protein
MLADLRARLKRPRLPSLAHTLFFLVASQLSEKDDSAFVETMVDTTLRGSTITLCSPAFPPTSTHTNLSGTIEQP